MPRYRVELMKIGRSGLSVVVWLLLSCVTARRELALAQEVNTGRASIYVYREGSMVGAAGHPFIFVNDHFLAALRNSNVAKTDVVPGAVYVSATVSTTGKDPDHGFLRQSLPPDLLWPRCEGTNKKAVCGWDSASQSSAEEDHGCGKVDWTRVEDAPKDDLKICAGELYNTSASIDHWLYPRAKATAIALGMILPGSFGTYILVNGLTMRTGNSSWLRMCGPSPYPAPGSSPEAAQELKSCQQKVAAALALTQLHNSLKLNVEANRSYYIRWSGSSSGGKLEVEDEATGNKAAEKLHPPKD